MIPYVLSDGAGPLIRPLSGINFIAMTPLIATGNYFTATTVGDCNFENKT